MSITDRGTVKNLE